MEKLSTYLNYIAATILALSIFLGLYFIFVQISSKAPKQHITIIDISKLNSKDSLIFKRDDVNKLKNILDEIRIAAEDIKKQQSEFASRENENFFDKIYTAITAIVIAITGFFGFKSVSDIKERAIKDAKYQAETTAKSEFHNVFTTEYKAAVAREVTDIIMSRIVKEQLDVFEKRISNLESGISGPANEKQDNNPKNPFG